VLRVRVGELRRLVEISGELSDVLLSAFDARRRLLKRMGEGGLVLAGDDDRDLHWLQEFAERNQFPYRTVLRSDASAVHGTSRLSALNWRDHVLERDVTLNAAGLFMMIGADPSTTWLHEVGVDLDANGFVVTRDGFVTSVPGVFAVGDVRAGSVKRVASAVGEGSVELRRPLLPRRHQDVLTAALEFRRGGNTARRQPEEGSLCHRYDASITSASPSRTLTP
jgi:hypothetical protein